MENQCNHSCKCCDESIEEFNARTDAKLRGRSLTLANALCVLLLGAHIYFAIDGKELKLPYEFYVIMLSPYGGAALQKVVAKLTNGKSK